MNTEYRGRKVGKVWQRAQEQVAREKAHEEKRLKEARAIYREVHKDVPGYAEAKIAAGIAPLFPEAVEDMKRVLNQRAKLKGEADRITAEIEAERYKAPDEQV